ncbi:MAG: hypothetical protein KF891_23270 [Rhizobacter sp.]|nr:hypothetical protein [Rhizobacter sp.]
MTQNINLYDASLRTRRDWLTAANAAAAVGACSLVIALATGWSHYEVSRLSGPAAETRAALEAAQAELAELTQRAAEARPDTRLQADVQLAQTTLTQRQSALELLHAGGLGNDVGHAGALSAFARQSINGLWLTGVVLDQQQVALRGRALSAELIPAYVSRLNKEAALQGRSFRALSVERPLQPADAAASVPARAAPYVEFSLVSAQGTEAPAKAAPKETAP